MKEIKDAIKVLMGSALTASWFLGAFVHKVFFLPAGVGSFILAMGVLFWIIENWNNS